MDGCHSWDGQNACLYRLIRCEQPVIREHVHEITRERPREQARRKSRIARASRKRRYQESSTESRVQAGLRQVAGNDDRRQKSQKAREWLWLPQYNASYEEHSGLWYHSRGYITDDGEFVNARKRKHYMCASVMEWNMI